jgi:hypothetical protein
MIMVSIQAISDHLGMRPTIETPNTPYLMHKFVFWIIALVYHVMYVCTCMHTVMQKHTCTHTHAHHTSLDMYVCM